MNLSFLGDMFSFCFLHNSTQYRDKYLEIAPSFLLTAIKVGLGDKNPRTFGGMTAWAQELEALMSSDHTNALQPGQQGETRVLKKKLNK